MKGFFIWFSLGIVLALIVGRSSLPRVVWDWMAPTLREDGTQLVPEPAPTRQVFEPSKPPCVPQETLYALLTEQNEVLQHMLKEPQPSKGGPSPRWVRFLELDRKLLEFSPCTPAAGKEKRP